MQKKTKTFYVTVFISIFLVNFTYSINKDNPKKVNEPSFDTIIGIKGGLTFSYFPIENIRNIYSSYILNAKYSTKLYIKLFQTYGVFFEIHKNPFIVYLDLTYVLIPYETNVFGTTIGIGLNYKIRKISFSIMAGINWDSYNYSYLIDIQRAINLYLIPNLSGSDKINVNIKFGALNFIPIGSFNIHITENFLLSLYFNMKFSIYKLLKIKVEQDNKQLHNNRYENIPFQTDIGSIVLSLSLKY